MSRRTRKKPNTNKTVAMDKNKTVAMDSFSNMPFRLGFGTLNPLEGTTYPLTRLTQNYQLMTSLYRDNWVVQNIVSIVPNDMLKKWYTIKTGIAPEYLRKLTRLEQKTKLRKKLALGMYWGRLYGGAAGVILIKGHNDLSMPLDYDTILPDSFLGIQIFDRWNGIFPDAEIVTDQTDPDFGLPKYYTVRDEATERTVARVHHSRVIRFIGRELPYIEQLTENYWGESEIEAIYSEVVKRDNVSTNIASLTFRANVNYLEMEGLDQLLGTGNTEMQRRFWNALAAQSVMESNFGTRIVNKGDTMHNTQYTFAGIADVYDRIMMDVAGAARMPVTKLFGRSPAGLDSTGESDLTNYYDYIDGLRESDLRPIIERLLPILCLSAWGVIPDDIDIDFEPMETPDAKEIAEIAERKTNTVLAVYQNDLIDAATAQQELKNISEETGMFSKISDESIEAGKGITYTRSRMMADPMSGIIGGLNAGDTTTENI